MMMECLHGKPASCSTTKKRSFWFCGQKPSCGFLCTEDEGYVYQMALAAWRAIDLKQPICESHHKPAKFRVVKDIQKESYVRPYFTCAERENPYSLWMWADEKQVEKPNCHHGQPCVMKKVKKEGPNTGRKLFCCCNENQCGYFEWAPEEPLQPTIPEPFIPMFYNSTYF
jgi:hypothetical protein